MYGISMDLNCNAQVLRCFSELDASRVIDALRWSIGKLLQLGNKVLDLFRLRHLDEGVRATL